MSATPSAAAAPATTTVPSTTERPLGVTILGVFVYIGAVFAILGGLMAMAIGAIAAPFLATFLGPLAAYMLVAGVGLLALGVFYAILAPATMKGKSWAWVGLLAAIAIGAAMSLLNLLQGEFGSVLSLAIDAAVVWYLFTPDVKAFFGQSHVKAPWEKATA